MSAPRSACRASVLALSAVLLAGCGGIAVPGFGPSTPPVEELPSAPAVNMAGRWMLTSPGRGQCLMTFGAPAANGAEGTVAPQGGCPGKFFTSRKWSFLQGELVLRDHNGQPLAQLSSEGAQFAGKATGGEPVTLAR